MNLYREQLITEHCRLRETMDRNEKDDKPAEEDCEMIIMETKVKTSKNINKIIAMK
jgi:hypothetical protein